MPVHSTQAPHPRRLFFVPSASSCYSDRGIADTEWRKPGGGAYNKKYIAAFVVRPSRLHIESYPGHRQTPSWWMPHRVPSSTTVQARRLHHKKSSNGFAAERAAQLSHPDRGSEAIERRDLGVATKITLPRTTTIPQIPRLDLGFDQDPRRSDASIANASWGSASPRTATNCR